MNHRSHLGEGGGIPSLLNQPICVLKGKYFFSKMHCAYLALGLLLLPAVTPIMCYKWWHTKQTGLQAHVIVLHYQSDNQKEQELWLLNWSISRFCVVDIIYIQKWGLNIFNIFPARVRTLLGLLYADSWVKAQHKTCLKSCFHRLRQENPWLLMKLIQVYTSNFTSVSTGILSDVTGITPSITYVIRCHGDSSCDLHMWQNPMIVRQCMEIQQEQCRYIYR